MIFKIPDVTIFFSSKLNQDLLEKHFGRLRQQGSTNDNPTVAEAIKNTQTIRVVNGIWVDDIVGNCRGGKEEKFIRHDLNEPLPKRKKLSK